VWIQAHQALSLFAENQEPLGGKSSSHQLGAQDGHLRVNAVDDIAGYAIIRMVHLGAVIKFSAVLQMDGKQVVVAA
jgi:hypothetical protein